MGGDAERRRHLLGAKFTVDPDPRVFNNEPPEIVTDRLRKTQARLANGVPTENTVLVVDKRVTD